MNDFNDLINKHGKEVAGDQLVIKAKATKKSSQIRAYGMIPTRLWMGHLVPAFSTLSAFARLLYLYLLSAPTANMAGLYYLNWNAVPSEVGLELEQTITAREELVNAGLISYDTSSKEVWIRDYIQLQVSDEPLNQNDKRMIGLQRTIQQARSVSLRQRCLEELELIQGMSIS